MTSCQVLIGGFGRPGMRDLDFGRQVVDYLQQLKWPDDVVIEDLSCSVPLVLHRLQELRPAKVVLLGAVPRRLDPPATVRSYRLDLTSPPPVDVHRSLEEAVTGLTDIDHTLAVARHWGGLPVDTVVIEVEPAEAAFGLGFSEELAACFDPILDMVREEVGGGGGPHPDLEADDLSTDNTPPVEPAATEPGRAAEPSDAIIDLLGYAHDHAQARSQSHRAPALVDGSASDLPGVAVSGRVRPWGVFVDSGGDWFDAVPLPGGGLGIVVGNLAGRGVEVAAAMSDLRAAVRAYAVLDGDSPARLVGHLDRLATATGLGHEARLLYVALHAESGTVRFTNAGSCPPLLLDDGFLDDACSAPLGRSEGSERPEAILQLAAGSTLLLSTDGLVQSRTVPRAAGLERLRIAAVEGPCELDDLVDHVLTVCTEGLRRDDDICLVGVRLVADAVPAQGRPSHRSVS